MVAMFDLIDHGREFPAQPFIQADAEDLADAVRRQAPEADFTASFEDFVDREVAFEDEIAAVLDLRNGVKPRQVH